MAGTNKPFPKEPELDPGFYDTARSISCDNPFYKFNNKHYTEYLENRNPPYFKPYLRRIKKFMQIEKSSTKTEYLSLSNLVCCDLPNNLCSCASFYKYAICAHIYALKIINKSATLPIPLEKNKERGKKANKKKEANKGGKRVILGPSEMKFNQKRKK